jgi:hypothetical protein
MIRAGDLPAGFVIRRGHPDTILSSGRPDSPWRKMLPRAVRRKSSWRAQSWIKPLPHRCVADCVAPVDQTFVNHRLESYESGLRVRQDGCFFNRARQHVRSVDVRRVRANSPIRSLALFRAVGVYRWEPYRRPSEYPSGNLKDDQSFAKFFRATRRPDSAVAWPHQDCRAHI